MIFNWSHRQLHIHLRIHRGTFRRFAFGTLKDLPFERNAMTEKGIPKSPKSQNNSNVKIISQLVSKRISTNNQNTKKQIYQTSWTLPAFAVMALVVSGSSDCDLPDSSRFMGADTAFGTAGAATSGAVTSAKPSRGTEASSSGLGSVGWRATNGGTLDETRHFENIQETVQLFLDEIVRIAGLNWGEKRCPKFWTKWSLEASLLCFENFWWEYIFVSFGILMYKQNWWIEL